MQSLAVKYKIWKQVGNLVSLLIYITSGQSTIKYIHQ